MVDPVAGDDTDSVGNPTLKASLLALQRLDIERDQLARRRDRLPEQATLTEIRAAAVAWEHDRQAMQVRIGELNNAIEQAETRIKDLGERTERLEAQLKTVVVLREAEALMSEIATLAEEHDVVDTTELEAMEALTEIEEQLSDHLAQGSAIHAAVAAADAAADTALAAHDAETTSLIARCNAARGHISDQALDRYDSIRNRHLVAVSELRGRQCTGCHLDLSLAEIDELRHDAAQIGDVADCPQCGRMIVV